MKKKLYNGLARVRFCKVYITNTKNNTFATVHLVQNETRHHFSCGKLGTKGSKKKTGYATQQVIRAVIKKLKEESAQQVTIHLSGYKKKLSSAMGILMTYLTKNKVQLLRIQSTQPIAYNGTKPPKKRRI